MTENHAPPSQVLEGQESRSIYQMQVGQGLVRVCAFVQTAIGYYGLILLVIN